MSGFPAAWDDGAWDAALPSDSCPYTREEIEDYLHSNHSRWVLEEPEMPFHASAPLLSRRELGRNFWLCSATDDLQREWFVVIGSGQSPFDPSEKVRRWMYAETNELGKTPDEFLDDAIDDQLMHDARRQG